MHCRVVFSGAKRFADLGRFQSHVRDLVSMPYVSSDANFFLFGEDILGLYSRAINSGMMLDRPVTHEQVVALIKSIQAFLHPRDFVVFSLYASLGSTTLSAAYLVGKRQWFFDFKRFFVGTEFVVLGADAQGSWDVQSKLIARSHHCIRSGDACIKDLHLIVCADIGLMPKVKFGKDALCFIPACALQEDYLHACAKRLSGKGRIFINDATNGCAWDISFSGKKADVRRMEFGKAIFLSLEFER